ncbi:MAG: methyltransferase [Magnetospirillum sp.]|nr:methyltransferase [Magnetospirillum sp.]
MPVGESFPTSLDRFLGGRVAIRQPVDGFRAGGDAMLLAAAVAAKAGESVLDLGCGVGTAGLCLLARLPEVRVVGLELQPELAALARANVLDNGAEGKFAVVEGDLAAPPDFGRGFDHVMTNPPWWVPGTTRAPRTDIKAVAHVEGEIDLSAWLKAALKLLKGKGRLTVIHRADRLGDLLAAIDGLDLGAVRVLPLWPKPGRAAIRVVVTARKGMRSPLELLPGLILHHADGRYTAAADAVLREAGALL